ncbi:hypothetical protein CNMCM6106_004410 [Aspergillus hiratsukae]|nr:hypothetical protein CNMCM6106_004410 [Aspergillus hiratsukae]
MAGQEHKASIYAHTHNDRLWALFWSRVAACRGLEELRLSIDLGRFTRATDGGLLGGQRLRLDVREPWVAPLLSVRGLRVFELGITARCDADAVVRSFLEGNLRRDAGTLRDHLRAVMCSAPGEAVLVPGVELWKLVPCPVEEGDEQAQPDRPHRSRPRLAITAK